jgi:hypothetical protein
LFVALATKTWEVHDAAALVMINLPECVNGQRLSPKGRYTLAQRLCAVYDLLGEKMGDAALAAKVIQGHLFVRNAQEWNVRVADGGYARQIAWLHRYLETYDLYLNERSRDVAFFSKGGWDKSSEATQQRNNRNRQMRDKLSREVANTKTHGCANSMKGCWKYY